MTKPTKQPKMKIAYTLFLIFVLVLVAFKPFKPFKLGYYNRGQEECVAGDGKEIPTGYYCRNNRFVLDDQPKQPLSFQCTAAFQKDYPEYQKPNYRAECVPSGMSRDCFCRIYEREERSASYVEKELTTIEFDLK